VTPRMSPTIPHVWRTHICKNTLRKEGIEPPRTSFKLAPYPICLSLHKILVKQLHNFVKVKLQTNPPYIFMAHPLQLGLQDATSPIIEELLNFHDHTLIIVYLISSLVLYIISLILTTKLTHTNTIDAQEVETILPAIILIIIVLPSLWILYIIDKINNPVLTVKTIGHQWYWSYEYTDYEDLTFNS
jgi:hypothetical protein